MRPDGECLLAGDWVVGDCELDAARRLILAHHYAGGCSNTATHAHGLFRRRDWELFGVTQWIPPTRQAAASVWAVDPDAVLTLSRMAIIPSAPKNSATFLLGRSEKLLGRRWECLLTYADTWRGHTGAIYRASNWTYLGLTKPERVYLIDGRMVARKAGPKTRTHAEMIALGAEMIGSFPRHKFVKVRRLGRVGPPLEATESLTLDHWFGSTTEDAS